LEGQGARCKIARRGPGCMEILTTLHDDRKISRRWQICMKIRENIFLDTLA
jgi:hypothetical protein